MTPESFANISDSMQTEYLTFIADFKVKGRFACLSHQETLSLWQRILVRAHVPLVYSQGYNPRPRVSLPLPRSVGVQSECERLCVQVRAGGFCKEAARRAIISLLPEGCTLTAVETVPGKAPFYPVSATYQFTLCAVPDAEQREHFQRCIEQLQNSEPIMLIRQTAQGTQRPIDIRPFLESLSLEGQIIRAICVIRPGGTVRLDELMQWLNLKSCDLVEMVRRVGVRWASNINHLQGEYHLS